MEGSLAVIENLFGTEIMHRVMKQAKYPNKEIRTQHNSTSLNFSAILSGIRKVFLQYNLKIGILLQNGINELDLAAVFDAYSRSLPSSIQGVILNGSNTIITKYGLTVISTDSVIANELDELHILNPENITGLQLASFKAARWISNYNSSENYILDNCLMIIKEEYGASFQNFVKRTLDYN
jgi:hypothetical protein